jgi:peptide-methionine (S)-S-oxide reductase
MLRMALVMLLALTGAVKAETAIVAGGCFWCVEADFEPVAGVSDVVSGFTGGEMENPTYRNHDGHLEAVMITFDPAVISYGELVAKFLRSVDVLDAGGQFCDRGESYRTAIFVQGEAQRKAAEAAVAEAEAVLGQKIVTPVLQAGTFWKARGLSPGLLQVVRDRADPGRAEEEGERLQVLPRGLRRDARVRDLWGAEAFPR